MVTFLAAAVRAPSALDDRIIGESLDSMDSGVAIYDSDLRLVMANRQFLELRRLPARFGQPGAEFADQLRYRVQRGDYGDADPEAVVNEYVELVRRAEPHRVEHRQADGTWMEIRGNPLPCGGFISTYMDVTERKQAELRILERERDLERMVIDLQASRHHFEEQASEMAGLAETAAQETERAVAADRAKSEFLANASHELRTPLTSIIGFSHLARKKLDKAAPAEDIGEMIGYVMESGEHLLELINDLLDVSKVESGNDELVEETFDIADVVNSSVRLVQQRAEESGVALEGHIDDSIARLFADKRKTKQILVNLLSNAVKFTPNGGLVSLTVSHDVDGGVEFRVADTGIGMAPEDIPKALAVFGQIDSTLGRKHQGTGLGLPLSKALAELHAGSLAVESAPGAGTTVILRLPAVRSVDAA